MLKILNQQKGFKLDFKQQKKELTLLQRKCINICTESTKFFKECEKHKESQQFQSEVCTIVALLSSIGNITRTKNDELVRIHLKAIYDFVNKINFETVPKVFLKDFLTYRKKVIELVGRM